MFYDILERKNDLLGYKKKKFGDFGKLICFIV